MSQSAFGLLALLLVLAACSGQRPTVLPTTTSPTTTATTSTTVASVTTTTAASTATTVPIEVSNAFDAVSNRLWTTVKASMALIPGKHTQQPAATRAAPVIATYLIGIQAIPFPSYLANQAAAATNPWPDIESLFTQLSTTAGGSAAAQTLIGELQSQVPPAIAAINTLRNAVSLSPLT